MIRNSIFRYALIGVLAAVLAAPLGVPARADQSAPGSVGVQTFSRAELGQMLAPVALYPDSLLAQILIAATYPTEVVEADRWVKEHKGWSRSQINAALDHKDWDLSIKALVPFPRVLAMMDNHLNWTTRLGEAFLAQQKQVMATVQELRHKAYAQGNLKTTSQQDVTVSGGDIEIAPANPEVVYVPYYNPLVVYGSWWWPEYPPFVFYPYGEPIVTYGPFGFLAAVSVGPYWNWGWGYWNWGDDDVYVNVNRYVNINSYRARIRRADFRTEGFRRFARRRRFALGGRAVGFRGGRTFGHRPSAASVARGFRRGGRAGFGAHGRAGANFARRGGFHGGGFHGRAGANFGGHGFARRGGFHGGGFHGGAARFGGHGFARLGGGGFHGGGFHGGGFHGGGFHGGLAHFGGHGFASLGGGFHGGGFHGGGFHGGGFHGGGFHGGGFHGGGFHGGGFHGGGFHGGGGRGGRR